MATIEITSLSSKGQVVIPGVLRKELNIKTGAKMMVFSDGKNILLKPVSIPKMDVFKKLIEESEKLKTKKSLKPNDLKKLIKQVRNESNR